jgi:hypothetical protein
MRIDEDDKDIFSFLDSVPPEDFEELNELIDQQIQELVERRHGREHVSIEVLELVVPREIKSIRKQRDNMIKVTYYNNLECCICYCDEQKTVARINGEILKITDIEPEKLYNGLTEDFIVLNPCGFHSTCVKCLRRLALDFTNHLINHEHSHIRCCSQDICESIMGISTYFSHYHIKKILTPEEYFAYIRHADLYEFPGFCKKKCPECHVFNIIPNEKIQESNRGELVVECAQNCRKMFCFYCDKIIYGFDNKICIECYSSNILEDENMLNSYYYKRLEDRKDNSDILYKNKELTTEIILEQLLDIVIDNKDVVIRCFSCLSNLYKTEQCNTLDHCKHEFCYSCGKIGEHIDSWKLGNHWSEYGIKGCPRFDSAPYWNEVANCGFKCIERSCHDYELGDCVTEEHQDGIYNMKEIRKSRLVYHKLKSLLRPQRGNVLEISREKDILKDYLPDPKVFEDIYRHMDYYYYYDPKIWMEGPPLDFDELSYLNI